MAKVLMLHVGAPKTGTSYLQRVIWNNHEVLEAQGVELGLKRPKLQLAAVASLRAAGWAADLDGASWHDLAAAVDTVSGTCLVSDELLCTTAPERIEAFLAAIDPATEVHVVYSARDAGRQVPAMWQHAVRGRQSVSFERFLERVRTDPRAPYWVEQSPLGALDRWGPFVAPGHFHLLTVPPPGSDPAELWHRFAGILGVRADDVELPDTVQNESLGLVETEVLRRLNARLGTRLPMRRQYVRSVRRHMIVPALATAPRRAPIEVPQEFADWLHVRAAADLAELRRRSGEFDLVGDLADLDLPITTRSADAPDLTDASVVLEAALDAWARQLEYLRERDLKQKELIDELRAAASLSRVPGRVLRRVGLRRERS